MKLHTKTWTALVGLSSLSFASATQALIIAPQVSSETHFLVNGQQQDHIDAPTDSITTPYWSPHRYAFYDDVFSIGSKINVDTSGLTQTSLHSAFYWKDNGEFPGVTFDATNSITREALITNDSATDISLNFDFNIFRGGMYGLGWHLQGEEYLKETYQMFVLMNDQPIWYSSATLLATAQETLLTKEGIDLNGYQDLFGYSWEAGQTTLDLGSLAAGESTHLSFVFTGQISGRHDHCNSQLDMDYNTNGCYYGTSQVWMWPQSFYNDKLFNPIDVTTVYDRNRAQVSEPTSLALGLAGLILLGLRRRWQR